MTRSSSIARWPIALCGLLVALQAFTLWSATGKGAWTTYFDAARAERERAAAESSLADLFDDAGLNDEAGKLERLPNEFRLGLLPATYPWRVWDRDFVSVATIAGPAVAASLLALAWPLLARRGVKASP